MIFFLSRARAGKKASQLSIGESLWLMENDELTEYFVVQQGNPNNTVYTDGGANGTWILRKDVANFGTYRQILTDQLSNGTYLARFPAEVQNALREVTLPRYYETTVEVSKSCTSKVHLPSVVEVGGTGSNSFAPTFVLEFFRGASNEDRIAYLDGTATPYWLWEYIVVTIDGTPSHTYHSVKASGEISAVTITNGPKCRPMMILDPDTKFDRDNIFVGL